MEDYYAALQVRPSASAEEIERAYRRLARANHPDLLRGVSQGSRQRAEDALKGINRAHRVLGDRERRREYDRQRRGAAPATKATPQRPSPPRPPTAATRPVADRTSHWGAGGPIDIEWETPPIRAQRSTADLFSLGRLLRYAAVIVLFAALLAIIWRPGYGQHTMATPAAPIATATPAITPTVPRPTTAP